MVHLTVQSMVHLRIRALKDALSDLQIDVKKVHLRLHLTVHLRLHLKDAFDGHLRLEGALVSATKDALEGRSEGTPKTVLRDLYKDVQESSFELELKGVI